jgi:hypothetical protein
MTVYINGSTGITSPSITTLDGTTRITGEIFKFTGNAVPTGSLLVPIAPTTVSRTTYSNLHSLYQLLGYPWGSGDGSSTFNIPYVPADQVFLSGNIATVGTSTVGNVIAHTHGIAGTGSSSGTFGAIVGQGTGTQSASTGGTANLPAGVRVLLCLKY